jgi:hypothetical protein
MRSTKTDTKAYTLLENNVLCCHFATIVSVCRMLIIIPFVYVLVTVLINAIDDWIAVLNSHAVRSSESIGEAFFDFSWLILYQW